MVSTGFWLRLTLVRVKKSGDADAICMPELPIGRFDLPCSSVNMWLTLAMDQWMKPGSLACAGGASSRKTTWDSGRVLRR